MSNVDLKKLKKCLLCNAGDKSYGRYKFLHDLREEIVHLVDEKKVSFAFIAKTLTENGHTVSAMTVGRYYRIFKKDNNNNVVEGIKNVGKVQKKLRNSNKKQHTSSTEERKDQTIIEQEANNNRTIDSSLAPLLEKQECDAQQTESVQSQTGNTTNNNQHEQQLTTQKPSTELTNQRSSSIIQSFKHGSGTGHFTVTDDDVI
jgi:hypothetical protein